MKIDNDLRVAIRAAAKAQPYVGHVERYALKTKAANAFLKERPALNKQLLAKVAKHKEARATFDRVAKELKKILEPNGLSLDDGVIRVGYGDSSEEAFTKAGGKLVEPRESWKADKVIAELVVADPSARKAILKKYGINWE